MSRSPKANAKELSRQEYHSKTLPAHPPERCCLPSCFATAPLSPSQGPAVGHRTQPGVSLLAWGLRATARPHVPGLPWSDSAIPVSPEMLQREGFPLGCAMEDFAVGPGERTPSGHRGMPARGCARSSPSPGLGTHTWEGASPVPKNPAPSKPRAHTASSLSRPSALLI